MSHTYVIAEVGSTWVLEPGAWANNLADRIEMIERRLKGACR